MTMLVFAIALEFLLLPEWEVESLEQCSAVTVIDRRCRNRDVHAPDLIDLVVLDLGENDLFLHAQAVVALAVERARRDAAEVTDAGHRNVDQPVEELVHASSTQRDLRADRESRTQLERCDRLARLRDEWLLPGDLGEIRDSGVHHLAVRNGFANTHVDRDLGDARHLHRVLDLEVSPQARHDSLAVKLLQPGHKWFPTSDAYASIISPFDLKKRTFLPSVSVLNSMRSAFLEAGLKIATFDTGRGIDFSRMPPCLPACGLGF